MSGSATTKGLTALLWASLTACSGAPERPPAEAPAANPYLGTRPLYATLVPAADGAWSFAEITAEAQPPESGFLVRLNDLSPAFDIRLAQCEPRPYPEQDRCNPLNPFRQKKVGMVDKLVSGGLAATTGGKLSGIDSSYTTEFDEADFNAAVDRALLDTGLDLDRAALIDGLAAYAAEVTAYDAELESLERDYLQRYAREHRQAIQIEAQITGLREYYAGDLAFDELVEIEPGEPAERAEDTAADRLAVLPCAASDCLRALQQARERARRGHEQSLARLRSRLQARTASYGVDCSRTQHAGYHFELQCPQRLERHDERLQILPLTVVIHARDFERLFPALRAASEELAVDTDGSDLVVRNLTDQYVQIQSVSLYYNSQINTVSNLADQLDLAPHALLKRPLAQFSSPAIDTEARYGWMTPDKASRASFSFGIALKYSVRDQDAVSTLHATNTYSVQCVIENRLRPGSCPAEQQSAAAVPATSPEDSSSQNPP